MSADRVAERLDALPGLAAVVADRVRGVLAPGALVGRRVVVTGCGLSEPPARVLAGELLRQAGARASYEAPAAFLPGAEPPRADLLVLVSHGLSPNGALPLDHGARYAETLVLTSVAPDPHGAPGARALARAADRGARVVVLPPELEEGLYLRLLAPSAALLAAVLLAEAAAPRGGDDGEHARPRLDPDDVARAWATREPPGTLVRDGRVDRLALVVHGPPLDWAEPLRAKLLEGVRAADPPIWDLLGFCHGPLQELHARPLTLLVCTSTDEVHRAERDQDAVLARFSRVLDPARHRVVLLAGPGHKSGTLGLFVREAMVHALVLDALRRVPLDLATWPGEGADAPLYALGPTTGRPEEQP